MSDQSIRLVSGEIASLWTEYMNNSMAECVLSYYSKCVDDLAIKEVVDYAHDLSQKQLSSLDTIFENDNIPIPSAFSSSDVDLDAPRLFTDSFILIYLRYMARFGMADYSNAVFLSARDDLRNHYQNALSSVAILHEKVAATALSKGVFIRTPYVPVAEDVEFAKQQSFLGKLVGKNRPLQATEITGLHSNLVANLVGKSLMTGFAQVAIHPKARDYFLRGKEISTKHISILGEPLQKEDIPTPMFGDSGVSRSTEAPFSDKLMLYHTSVITSSGLASYGMGIGASARSDLIANYIRLISEVMLFAEDGLNLMIDHGWLEICPQAPDRTELSLNH